MKSLYITIRKQKKKLNALRQPIDAICFTAAFTYEFIPATHRFASFIKDMPAGCFAFFYKVNSKVFIKCCQLK